MRANKLTKPNHQTQGPQTSRQLYPCRRKSSFHLRTHCYFTACAKCIIDSRLSRMSQIGIDSKVRIFSPLLLPWEESLTKIQHLFSLIKNQQHQQRLLHLTLILCSSDSWLLLRILIFSFFNDMQESAIYRSWLHFLSIKTTYSKPAVIHRSMGLLKRQMVLLISHEKLFVFVLLGKMFSPSRTSYLSSKTNGVFTKYSVS